MCMSSSRLLYINLRGTVHAQTAIRAKLFSALFAPRTFQRHKKFGLNQPLTVFFAPHRHIGPAPFHRPIGLLPLADPVAGLRRADAGSAHFDTIRCASVSNKSRIGKNRLKSRAYRVAS